MPASSASPIKPRRESPLRILIDGFQGVSWQALALIVAINTGVAAILTIDDSRPFWHPLITAQCFGLSIAYAVNAAQPWNRAMVDLALPRHVHGTDEHGKPRHERREAKGQHRG